MPHLSIMTHFRNLNLSQKHSPGHEVVPGHLCTHTRAPLCVLFFAQNEFHLFHVMAYTEYAYVSNITF